MKNPPEQQQELISRACPWTGASGSASQPSHRTSTEPDDRLKEVLEALEEESNFIKRHQPRPELSTPIRTINRTKLHLLFRLKSDHLSRPKQRALGFALARYKRSEWLRRQLGYREKLGIAICSEIFNGMAYCRCGQRGHFCKMPSYCPRCNLDQLVEPALDEYADAYEKANYWMALVPSSNTVPGKAGLRWCTQKDENGRASKFRSIFPFRGKAEGDRYQVDVEHFGILDNSARLPFKFAFQLKREGLISGAYTARELHMSFRPTAPGKSDVQHTALVHGNILLNTQHKPGLELMRRMFSVYVGVFQQANLPSYPDLMGSRLESQEEIQRWLSYSLKPMPFDRWYCEAVTRGCDLANLNQQFDETVFGGIGAVFSCVKSPRKIGNMYSQAKDYIGHKRPKRITKEQVHKWLNDLQFEVAHPDWEDSINAFQEKQGKRRGRNLPAREEL